MRTFIKSYGALGILVTKKEEVRPALERAIKTDNTVFIDFRIEPQENVYPMVPSGSAINKMIEGLA